MPICFAISPIGRMYATISTTGAVVASDAKCKLNASSMEELQTAIVPVELSDGTIVNIEATLRGEQQVSSRTQVFGPVKDTIKAVAKEMLDIVEQAQPDKVSIKLAVEVAVESGQLTACLVKGSSKANLEVTLEWSKSP
jgi:C4-type Zn-finger protein